MNIRSKHMKSIKFLSFTLFIILLSSFFVTKNIETLVSSISGVVKKGDGVARKYGYRTANMNIKQKLDCGIFNGDSKYGKTTIISNGKGFVECHIHDFKKNIYGKKLKIDNIRYIDKTKEKNMMNCMFAKQFTS